VFLIDDLLMAPGRALLFLFDELAKKAQEEWLDDGPVKQQLQEIYALLESGKISEREFESAEFALVQRLEQIARVKLHGSQAMAEPELQTVPSDVDMMPASSGVALPGNIIDIRPVDVAAPPRLVAPPAPPAPASPAVDVLALLREAFGSDMFTGVAAAPAQPERPPALAPPLVAPPLPVVAAAPQQVVAATLPPIVAAAPSPVPAPPFAASNSPLAAAAISSERPAVPVTGSLTISQVIECTMRGLSMLKLRVSALTSAARDEEGWRVTAEVIERKSVPDTSDLLGVYELRLDEAGNLLRYERIRMRRRCDLAGH
jgi:hypothetical protein